MKELMLRGRVYLEYRVRNNDSFLGVIRRSHKDVKYECRHWREEAEPEEGICME